MTPAQLRRVCLGLSGAEETVAFAMIAGLSAGALLLVRKAAL